MDKRVKFLDKLYGARNYIQLLALYADKTQTPEAIKEYEDEEFEYLTSKGRKADDIKKGFRYAKELAKMED